MGDYYPLRPILILIEVKYFNQKDTIYYHADTQPVKSIKTLSNSNKDLHEKTLESCLGNRNYREINIFTYNHISLEQLFEKMEFENNDENLIDNPDYINFQSGNPANETTEGIIHFYKDENNLLFDGSYVPSRILAMISVPRNMGIRDILDFISPCQQFIEEMKVVKDSSPNEYVVLLKFIHESDANNFYDSFNNAKFNSLEDYICSLVFVSHVEFLSSSTLVRFPLLDLTELPTCSVCLERLDEPLNGILTILCNHTFHSDCIQKMNEPTCPVCRYSQTPSETDDRYKCSVCDIRENLWLCLICANIACGRHDNKHAERHFEETGHTFSMKVGNNLVWDYAADAHVHRLVANTSDGKLVEVEGEEPEDKKAKDLCMEYTALLADQLVSQKMFLESEFCQKLSLAEEDIKSYSKALDDVNEELRNVMKDKQNLEKRISQIQTTLNKVRSEFEEEKLMNKSLLENQDHLKTQLNVRESEVNDLKEQVNDLIMNLQMGSKIAEAQDRGELNENEVSGASISIGHSSQHQGKSRRNRKK